MKKELLRSWCRGSITGVILLGILCMAGAALLSMEVIPVRAMGILRGSILGLAVAVSCLIAQRGSACGSLPVCAGTFAAILLVSAIGHYVLAGDKPWHTLQLAAAFAVMLLTAFLGAGRKKRY